MWWSIVGPDEALRVRVDGKGEGADAATGAPLRAVHDAQAGNARTPVVISADSAVKYEAVVKVMDTLQRAGVQRVGLAVKNSGT